MSNWTAAHVPDQSGRTAIITGSNTGIGYEAAAVLAAKGAHVVLAVRNTEKGGEAAERIKSASPHAVASVQELDLTSLESIRAAAVALRTAHPRIDLLINNAGVMHTPRAATKDGFELQFGTNHLGHFALTGQLLDNMLSVEGSRVVTISSQAHRFRGAIDFDDLHAAKKYDRAAAYARSKVANLMFTYELARRLESKGAQTIATAAHPGSSNTELTRNYPALLRAPTELVWGLMAQSAEMGALPTLRAATDPGVRNGEYYGPGGLGQQRGYPKRVESNTYSYDEEVQRRLWDVSEKTTNVTYPV
ncbi:SDR family NAD(P)-dependent oxidoreductase [Mycobacterium sp. 2YAF39]|uniref:SDR family NAD(P)-dependent oxidoreductase n=1 Tax=Mycobacterium sp. 2YAF39 TaxID=3233033 RepID=UPI003F98DBFA